ncbi:MAG: hypothetical protein RJB38_1491 [Pseudomonadota bacterium]|jgi:YfiH family protein
MKSLESALLKQVPQIRHAFGTAAEPVGTALQKDWKQGQPIWKQVHGTELARVLDPRQTCGEVDALWTDTPGCPVGVATADCVPLLLAEKTGRAVVAIHAGWRGTKDQILRPVFRSLRQAGYEPQDFVAAIGPCIQPCCFEVGPEVVETFLNQFPQLDESLLLPRPRHLDLPWIHEATLRGFGIEQIDSLRVCTKCGRDNEGNSWLLHSYRREGSGHRQWSIIIKDDQDCASLNTDHTKTIT